MIFPSLIIKIERWKFNKDYGVYVSTLGNFKDRYKRRLPVKICNRSGYCCVKTEQGMKYSHRVVMLTWKPIPDAENLTVDHLNHNKRDNSVQNLEWVSLKENRRRARQDICEISGEGDPLAKRKPINPNNPIVYLTTLNEAGIEEAVNKAMMILPPPVQGQIKHGMPEENVRKNFYNHLARRLSDQHPICSVYGINFIIKGAENG